MGHKSFNGVQFGWDTYYFRAIAEYKTREHSNLIDKGGSGIEFTGIFKIGLLISHSKISQKSVIYKNLCLE